MTLQRRICCKFRFIIAILQPFQQILLQNLCFSLQNTACAVFRRNKRRSGRRSGGSMNPSSRQRRHHDRWVHYTTKGRKNKAAVCHIENTLKFVYTLTDTFFQEPYHFLSVFTQLFSAASERSLAGTDHQLFQRNSRSSQGLYRLVLIYFSI